MHLQIRTARSADFLPVVELYNAIIREGGSTADLQAYTPAERRGWFDSHLAAPFPLLVAELDRTVVGYCYLSAWRPGRDALRLVAEISYYVRADHRRQGIGEKLLLAGMDSARQLGFRSLLAILLDQNDASIALLKANGFHVWGQLPGIANLPDRICGQLIMGLKLTA